MTPTPDTHHAPAPRADPTHVRLLADRVSEDPVLRAMMEAWDGYLLVLNAERQVLAANPRFLADLSQEAMEGILGLRPGEVVGCEHAADAPGGCGTGPVCLHCGVVNAILRCLDTGRPATDECAITYRHEGTLASLDLRVRASPHTVNGAEVVLVSLADDSDRKRREALERTFFHDLLNTVTSIQGWSDVLVQRGGQGAVRVAERIGGLTTRLGEEVRAHRLLLEAESGTLSVARTRVAAASVLAELETAFATHPAGRGRRLVLEAVDATIETDPVLLLRVLVNMVRNALEATPEGGTVTVRLLERPTEFVFLVHNPGVMPPEIAERVFRRSFSTKGRGRGIGTWSIRLFGERYLGGRVFFSSVEGSGTEFGIALPARWSAL